MQTKVGVDDEKITVTLSRLPAQAGANAGWIVDGVGIVFAEPPSLDSGDNPVRLNWLTYDRLQHKSLIVRVSSADNIHPPPTVAVNGGSPNAMADQGNARSFAAYITVEVAS